MAVFLVVMFVVVLLSVVVVADFFSFALPAARLSPEFPYFR